jgi:hypothetical protein
MPTHGPDASSTDAAEPLYTIDDGPLTEEDIEAIRAWEANPVGVPHEVILADLAARRADEA